jgi:[ribosomal protein S5]-alanine N-acetyltransferase
MGPTVLRTERLLLRPFRLADVDDVLLYACDAEWSRFLIAFESESYTRDDAERYVAQAILESWDSHPVFAVEFDNHVIGAINLHVNPRHKLASVGYGIARRFWGQGLTVEACRAVFDWSFRNYGLVKIYATTHAENHSSMRVMEKLGMKREALLRKQRFFRACG